jgi:hypothetical protein
MWSGHHHSLMRNKVAIGSCRSTDQVDKIRVHFAVLGREEFRAASWRSRPWFCRNGSTTRDNTVDSLREFLSKICRSWKQVGGLRFNWRRLCCGQRGLDQIRYAGRLSK